MSDTANTDSEIKPQVGNASVERIFTMGNMLHIDKVWGLNQYAQFRDELKLIAEGVPYSSLGISGKRHESQNINLVGSSTKTVKSKKASEQFPEGTIAIVPLSGVMRVESGMSNTGMKDLSNTLRMLDNNASVMGIILEVNSGGGESTAGQLLQNTLSDIKKPIVSYAHFMASAAYNASLGADEIIAAGSQSMIGSIGSMISIDKWWMEYLKEYYDDIYSDESPEKNKEFRAYQDGDKGPYKEMVKKSAQAFKSNVRQNRKLRGTKSFQEETLKGSMFYADEAKSRGLIDSIGPLSHAIQRISRIQNYKK